MLHPSFESVTDEALIMAVCDDATATAREIELAERLRDRLDELDALILDYCGAERLVAWGGGNDDGSN